MPELDPSNEAELLAAAVKQAERHAKDLRPVIGLRLTWCEAWLLMAELQLALRHPLNTGAAADYARQLAALLEKRCASTPELAALAQLGMQPSAPVEESEWLEATLP